MTKKQYKKYEEKKLKALEKLESKKPEVLVREKFRIIRFIKNLWIYLKIKKIAKKFRIIRFFQEIWISFSIKKLTKREAKIEVIRESQKLIVLENRKIGDQNLIKINHRGIKYHAV